MGVTGETYDCRRQKGGSMQLERVKKPHRDPLTGPGIKKLGGTFLTDAVRYQKYI